MHAMCRGLQLFPKFMEYMKSSKGQDEEGKREDLVQELRSIDADLQKTEGPYVGGNDVNAADLKLGPQLKHVMIGSKSVKVRLRHHLLGHALRARGEKPGMCAVGQCICCAWSNGRCLRS